MSDNPLYPDKVDRIKRIEEIEASMSDLILKRDSVLHEIDELSLEFDILKRLELLEQFINGEIKIKLNQESVTKE